MAAERNKWRFDGVYAIMNRFMALNFFFKRRQLSVAICIVVGSMTMFVPDSYAQYANYNDCMAQVGDASYCSSMCDATDCSGTPSGSSQGNLRPLFRPKKDLTLLQSPDDVQGKTLSPSPGIGIFFTYFNLAWPWVRGIAAGIAILWALIGAIEIMISGNDTGLREDGKGRIMWALAGLLLIGLAGFILNTLNPNFFIQA